MTRAPALTLSIMASASSSGVALGICPLPFTVSAKIGRSSSVQPGQIAGATEPRRAESMPATNVPCVHATLSARLQVPLSFPGISRMSSRRGQDGPVPQGHRSRQLRSQGGPGRVHQLGESDEIQGAHHAPATNRILIRGSSIAPARLAPRPSEVKSEQSYKSGRSPPWANAIVHGLCHLTVAVGYRLSHRAQHRVHGAGQRPQRRSLLGSRTVEG